MPKSFHCSKDQNCFLAKCLTVRAGSLGTPLCRGVAGVVFPLLFSVISPSYFFQRKKNCSRIYWDRLPSSSRGKKLKNIINLKCYFFYQPEVKFSQEAERHLRSLSNPTLPAKFRPCTHIISCWQQYGSLNQKWFFAIIFDLKRRSSNKYKCSYCASALLESERKASSLNSQIIWFISFFPLSPKHVSPPRGFLNICIVAYFIPDGFNKTDQSHHSWANHQHKSKGGGLQSVQTNQDTAVRRSIINLTFLPWGVQ